MGGWSSIRQASFTSKQLVEQIAQFASDKKAEDISILDMRKIVNFCDYFVICTGTSDRQVNAIAEGIVDGLDKFGHGVRYKQGLNNSSAGRLASAEVGGAWALLDMGDVVVHVFEPQAREFYALEYLWQDAPRISWKEKKPKRKAAH